MGPLAVNATASPAMSIPNIGGEPSPPYIPTVYDETFRAKHYMEPSIMSIANRATLLGYLDHHPPTTDGSFSICVAGGQGVFVSQVRMIHRASPEPQAIRYIYILVV